MRAQGGGRQMQIVTPEIFSPVHSPPREPSGQRLCPTKNGTDLSTRQEELLWSMRNLRREMDKQMNELELTLRGESQSPRTSKKPRNKMSPHPVSRTEPLSGRSYADSNGLLSEASAEPLLSCEMDIHGDARQPRSIEGTLLEERHTARNDLLGHILRSDAHLAVKASAAPGSYADAGNPQTRTYRQALRKMLHEDDTIETLYHAEGWAASLAERDWFKTLTTVIIFASSIWIAVETDLNTRDAPLETKQMFKCVDNLVLIYFAIEITVRFIAFSDKRQAFKLFSFNLDLVLVLIMVFVSWVLPFVVSQSDSHMHHARSVKLLRLFRLVRLARLARLVRALPDLATLVRGMFMAFRAVFSTLCLLTVVIYVFGIFFTQMLAGTGAVSGSFETVPKAMVCLLLDGIFNSQAGLIYNLLDIHWSYFVVIMVYECVAFLTFMNMLLGVICNEVTQVAKTEADAQRSAQIRAKLNTALAEMDDNGDGVISMIEFGELLEKPEFLRVLHDVGVDVTALMECGEYIFFKNGFSIPYEDFMEEVLKFRSANMCTVKDTVEIRLSLLYELKQMERRLQRTLSGLGPKVTARGMRSPSPEYSDRVI